MSLHSSFVKQVPDMVGSLAVAHWLFCEPILHSRKRKKRTPINVATLNLTMLNREKAPKSQKAQMLLICISLVHIRTRHTYVLSALSRLRRAPLELTELGGIL